MRCGIGLRGLWFMGCRCLRFSSQPSYTENLRFMMVKRTFAVMQDQCKERRLRPLKGDAVFGMRCCVIQRFAWVLRDSAVGGSFA